MECRQQKRFLIWPTATATIACVLVLAAGGYLLHKQPSRIDFFTFKNGELFQRGVSIRPRKSKPLGVIVSIHDRGSTLLEEGRNTLRYLADKGYVVISVNYRDNGMEGLQDARAITAWVMQRNELKDYPVYLTGFDLGGRLAILTACCDSFPRLKAVASIGSAAEWPFPEISPSEHIQSLSCPLLIVHGENDLVNPVSQAHLLENLCARQSKQCDLLIVKGASHFLDNEWTLVLDHVSVFFLQYQK